MPFFSHATLTRAVCGLALLIEAVGGEGVEPVLPETLGLSPWNLAASARVGGGYKDNVTLSAFAADGSSFLVLGADFFLFRAPWDGTEFVFLVTGEDRRYLDSSETEKEQTFLVSSQLKRRINDGWKMGVEAQYCYLDQIFDASATELDLGVVRAVGHSGWLRPSVGRALGRGTWLEVEALGGRYEFEAPLDDYWELGPRFLLRREYGRGSSVVFSYGVLRRPYDERLEANEHGVSLEGTQLVFLEQRAECAWQQVWDGARRWRTTTRIGIELNRDDGSGYFDYDRYTASEQVRVRWSRATVRARAAVSYYDYALQTVNDLTREKRHKILATFTLGADYQVWRRFKVFGDYEFEQSLSNQDYDEYRASTVFGGVECEF